MVFGIKHVLNTLKLMVFSKVTCTLLSFMGSNMLLVFILWMGLYCRFFVLSASMYKSRPDLVNCGRTEVPNWRMKALGKW